MENHKLMTYRPKHFTLPELVDPWFLANHTEAECWAMLDPNALKAIDALREMLGPILINGRGYTESGLRRSDTATGAKYTSRSTGPYFGWLHIDSKDTGPNNVNKIVIVKP
jgi:hypothetical protein